MLMAKVTAKGQIVIPAKIRKRLDIKAGARFFVEDRGQEIVFKFASRKYFAAVAGFLGTQGKLTRALKQERARELGREG